MFETYGLDEKTGISEEGRKIRKGHMSKDGVNGAKYNWIKDQKNKGVIQRCNG